MPRLTPALAATFLLTACASDGPVKTDTETTTSGELAPCPSSPNCVSSLADPEDGTHYLAPFELTGDVEAAQASLRELVLAMPRCELAEEREGYLRFVFTTRIFRWKDDVELVLDAAAGKVHFRSASRTGYGDMGVNRKRMLRIRDAWDAARPKG